MRLNQAEAQRELNESQGEIGNQIEQSRVRTEREMRMIRDSMSQMEMRNKEDLGRSQVAILDEQSENNAKIEARISQSETKTEERSPQIQADIKELKDLIIKASLDRVLTPLLPPSQPCTKDRFVTILVSLYNGNPIGKYAHYKTPLDLELEKAHKISDVITHINQWYGRPADNAALSESKHFNVVGITIPGEYGEANARTIVSSGRWDAWVNNVLVFKEDQVKVEVVFKLAPRRVQSSKKRKIGCEGQAGGSSIAPSDEIDEVRNVFCAFDW